MLYHGQSVVFDGFAWKNSRIRKGEQFPPIFVRVWMSMWFSFVRWRETHILITANRKMMYVADVVVFVVISSIVFIVVSHMNVNTILSGKETANHIEKKFPFLCFSSRQWITSKEFIESLLRQIGLREYLCDMKVITITQRYGGVGVCGVPNYVQIVLGGFKQWKLVNVFNLDTLRFLFSGNRRRFIALHQYRFVSWRPFVEFVFPVIWETCAHIWEFIRVCRYSHPLTWVGERISCLASPIDDNLNFINFTLTLWRDTWNKHTHAYFIVHPLNIGTLQPFRRNNGNQHHIFTGICSENWKHCSSNWDSFLLYLCAHICEAVYCLFTYLYYLRIAAETALQMYSLSLTSQMGKKWAPINCNWLKIPSHMSLDCN